MEKFKFTKCNLDTICAKCSLNVSIGGMWLCSAHDVERLDCSYYEEIEVQMVTPTGKE